MSRDNYFLFRDQLIPVTKIKITRANNKQLVYLESIRMYSLLKNRFISSYTPNMVHFLPRQNIKHSSNQRQICIRQFLDHKLTKYFRNNCSSSAKFHNNRYYRACDPKRIMLMKYPFTTTTLSHKQDYQIPWPKWLKKKHKQAERSGDGDGRDSAKRMSNLRPRKKRRKGAIDRCCIG